MRAVAAATRRSAWRTSGRRASSEAPSPTGSSCLQLRRLHARPAPLAAPLPGGSAQQLRQLEQRRLALADRAVAVTRAPAPPALRTHHVEIRRGARIAPVLGDLLLVRDDIDRVARHRDGFTQRAHLRVGTRGFGRHRDLSRSPGRRSPPRRRPAPLRWRGARGRTGRPRKTHPGRCRRTRRSAEDARQSPGFHR